MNKYMNKYRISSIITLNELSTSIFSFYFVCSLPAVLGHVAAVAERDICVFSYIFETLVNMPSANSRMEINFNDFSCV